MRFRNLHFLSKANIRGNKNSGTITLLICLLVVAVTMVSSYSVVTISAVNRFKEDYRARALPLSPYLKPITDEALEAISSVEHVELVTDVYGMLYPTCPFNITESNDVEINEQAKERGTILYVDELYENEKKSVIKGKSLDDAPVFSCLVPSIFYPYDDAYALDYKNLDYIDGTTLIGKTITVEGIGDGGNVDFHYYTSGDNGCYEQILTSLHTPKFTLKVVGTYPCSRATSGSFETIYVSRETGLLMTQMTMEETGIYVSSDESDISLWWNTPALHEYLVVVDNYNNIPEVFNSISKMGYDISSNPMQLQDDTTVLLANLFSTVGTFLTVAIVFISVVILVQSSTSAIKERRGYIGLMKAIGYKNGQVFLCLCWEQLYLSLRAFVIGGVISTAVTSLINLGIEHGTYRQTQYIMNWDIYFMFLVISFLIALLVPLVTEILLLRRLTKIQPRDAMTAK